MRLLRCATAKICCEHTDSILIIFELPLSTRYPILEPFLLKAEKVSAKYAKQAQAEIAREIDKCK